VTCKSPYKNTPITLLFSDPVDQKHTRNTLVTARNQSSLQKKRKTHTRVVKFSTESRRRTKSRHLVKSQVLRTTRKWL